MSEELRSLLWTGSSLCVLDQVKLPFEIEWIECTSYRDVYSVIKNMNTRGAPAIGVAAAYGMALAAREALTTPQPAQFVLDVVIVHKSARPTAVNLAWAVNRSLAEGAPSLGKNPRAAADELATFASKLARDDRTKISLCRSTV